VPKWSDFGNIWSTLKDVDVSAVREEAERPIGIACIGHATALAETSRLLSTGDDRYPASGPSPLTLIPVEEAGARAAELNGADLLVFAVDATRGLTPAESSAFGRAEALGPYVVAVIGPGAQALVGLPPATAARAVSIADPSALDAADRLAGEVLRRMPTELQLAAARRLPGLRAVYARELIGTTSFSNASYSLASGLPQQIPILGVPFAAADIILLTKNQAMMVYRLALAYGAPPGFQERIREVLPVVGGAFLWRQAARSLAGLIPVWGLVPKVAIAYAGTYTTGVAAWRWFERGELVSGEQLKRISSEALTLGRARAAEIIARARDAGSGAANQAGENGRNLWGRLRSRLPRHRQPSLTAQNQPETKAPDPGGEDGSQR
jgi:uncharacterized protein (DUF697 family)